MKKRVFSVGGLILTVAALVVSLLHGSGAAAQTGNGPAPFADPAFEKIWTRTDKLVAQGQAARSWFWGPQPRASMHEQLLESPGGQRLVQYFDKSRMEINNPNADPNGAFYVTNGLLTVELVSGNMQIGESAYTSRSPACINIAGDSDDPTAPTYNSFRQVATVAPGMGKTEANKVGQVATGRIDRNGAVTDDSSKSGVTDATYAYYAGVTQHNIPQVFWNYLNQQGPVIENGQVVTQQLIVPWFYASGYPVSDAFWARVKVAGTYEDVLIQAYERRVLTYNPANTPAFQVEMGNIGLHYYDWRYNNAGICAGVTPVPTSAAPTSTPGPIATATATATPAASPTVVPLTGRLAWTRGTAPARNIWIANPDGTTPLNLTAALGTDNYDPAFSPDGNQIAFVRQQGNTANIYTMDFHGGAVKQLTNNVAGFLDTHPTWGPDGKHLAFTSTRSGNEDIWVMNADGTLPVNITLSPGSDREPSWGSNNRIAFTSRRSGRDEIWAANPDGTAPAQLTNVAGGNVQPSWSPGATRILFVSSRDGSNPEIYAMKIDGSDQNRLTNLLSSEFDPTWSPDGRYIAYTSNRDGNDEIYSSYLDGTNLRRLTTDPADDTHPTWR